MRSTAASGISGVIDGGGSLTKTGSGMLTLGGSNLYTGVTTVSGGTVAVRQRVDQRHAGIIVSQGCLLQVSGSGGQLLGSGSITLNGGNLNYSGNVSAGTAGEVAGALLLNPGQSNITTSNTPGSGSSYLRFAGGGPLADTAATVNFAVSSTNASIQFQGSPPGGSGSIIGGYAYYNNADFAALTATVRAAPIRFRPAPMPAATWRPRGPRRTPSQQSPRLCLRPRRSIR